MTKSLTGGADRTRTRQPSDDGTPRTRVVHVVPSLGAGGSERSLFETLAMLPESVESHVLCFHDRDDGVAGLTAALGVPITKLDGGYFRRVAAVVRYLRRHAADVVHTSVPEADLVGRVAGRLARVSVMSTLVNTPYVSYRDDDPSVNRWALRGHRLVDRMSSRLLVDHFRAVSNAVADHAVEHLGLRASRITVIPRGRSGSAMRLVEPAERAEARTRLGIDDSTMVIGTVGRLVFQKAGDVLLRSVAELVRDPDVSDDFILLHTGPAGPEKGRLTAMVADLGLQSHVRFLGAQPSASETVLPAIDIFAFPSRYEGMPGALIEALGRGLPTVVSDIAPNREVAGDSVLFAPVDDHVSLARHLRALMLDAGLRSRLSSEAHGRVVARFDMTIVAAQEAALFARFAPSVSR